jgi:KDO2-lipid IV(A) lauroyltransferase
LSEGRGAVFISAHLGPFELLPAAIAELGVCPAIVVRESYDPRLDAWVDHHRHSRGIVVIHRGAPGAAVRIVRALRAGQPVGFLPDLGGRVPQIPTNFLGRRTGFAVGPQQIAQRMGAPIVVGTLRRLPGPGPRHTLSIERVETTGTLAELTQRVARTLERAILDAGEDFPWMAPLPRMGVCSEAAEVSAPRSGDSRIAGATEKGLDLSTTCSSEGGMTWDKGSEASRA